MYSYLPFVLNKKKKEKKIVGALFDAVGMIMAP